MIEYLFVGRSPKSFAPNESNGHDCQNEFSYSYSCSKTVSVSGNINKEEHILLFCVFILQKDIYVLFFFYCFFFFLYFHFDSRGVQNFFGCPIFYYNDSLSARHLHYLFIRNFMLTYIHIQLKQEHGIIHIIVNIYTTYYILNRKEI